MNRFSRHAGKLLALGAAALFFLPLSTRALWDSDEGRYAEIAREMLELKSWITPHLNYVLYFEKPPLMYWLTALSLKAFGLTEFAARFWCAAFGLLTVLITYVLGKHWRNERTGLLAGGILATSVLFFGLTQYLVLDMALTFWMTLLLYAFSRLLLERSKQKGNFFVMLSAVAVAGGILTKGPVALVLPLLVFGVTIGWAGVPRAFSELPWAQGFALLLVLTLPWFVLVSLYNPVFPYFFFIREHFQRYLTTLHHRDAPVYFFIPVVLLGFLPWSVFLPKVVVTWWGHGRQALKRDPVGALLMFWASLIFVFFSFSQSKLVAYVLPIFPALALLTAYEFEPAFAVRPMPAWISRGLAVLIVVFFSGLVALKCPSLPIQTPEWTWAVAQSGLLSFALSMAVFLCVGIWGMRQTAFCYGGVVGVQILLFTVITLMAPSFDSFLSARAMAQQIQKSGQSSDPVVVYGVSYENMAQSLVFYLGRRVAVFGDDGELAMGREQAADASAWFVPREAMTEGLLKMPSQTWVVTHKEYWDPLRQSPGGVDFQEVGRQERLVLLQKVH